MIEMRRVATGVLVDYPIRVDHIDGTWTLIPNTDRRMQGRAIRCDSPICLHCTRHPPVALNENGDTARTGRATSKLSDSE